MRAAERPADASLLRLVTTLIASEVERVRAPERASETAAGEFLRALSRRELTDREEILARGRELSIDLADGASVIVYDVSETAIRRVQTRHPGVTVAASRDDLVTSESDVYAPCALGGAIDEATLTALRARIVCGGANNQLGHPGIDKLLDEHEILYAPDYVVNAGGVIQVADELAGFNFERAKARAEQIFDTTRKILTVAGQESVPPAAAADRLAERRMSEVGRLRGIWLGG